MNRSPPQLLSPQRQLAGPSMLPTFNEAGDIVVVDCLHVKLGRPLHKGDIVIAKSPTNPGNTVCKRVLGLVSSRLFVGRGNRMLGMMFASYRFVVALPLLNKTANTNSPGTAS